MNKMTDMDNKGIDRRDFFRAAGAGLTAATVVLNPAERALAQFRTDKDRLERVASCTWPIRSIFKSRPGGGRGGGGAWWWRHGGCAGWHRARRGGASASGDGAGRRSGGRSGRAAVAVQWRLDDRADEGEVRRDHHAGLPAVHQGHLPGRHAHGPVLGPVR